MEERVVMIEGKDRIRIIVRPSARPRRIIALHLVALCLAGGSAMCWGSMSRGAPAC
jgi:hypothetical protein